jgi:hypothetical protein
MSGLTDLIRERRAREIRRWEEDDETTTAKAVWNSLAYSSPRGSRTLRSKSR